MAGKPIRIPIISDVADFLRGTKDVEDALDDVVDSLDEVNDAGKKDDATEALGDLERAADDAKDALDDLGKDSKDSLGDVETATKDAEDAVGKLETKFRAAMDTVKKDADDAGKKVGKDLDDGFDKAKKGADDFKDEAGQSGREAAASFSGEFDDVQDFIQETAANAFGGFGPAGAAAGLAAAAGIGLVGAAFQKSKEEAEDLRDLAQDIGDQLRETGEVDLSDNLSDWIFDHVDSLEDLKQAAEDSGVSLDDLMLAYQGDTSALDRVKEQWDAYGQSIEDAGGSGVVGHGVLQDLYDEVLRNEEATGLAADANELMADQQGALADEADRLNESLKTQLDYLRQLRDEATNGVQAQIDYQDQLAATNETITTNGENWDIATQEGRDNQQAVIDLADEMNNLTSAQIDSGASLEDVNDTLGQQKDALYETAIQAGATEEEAQDMVDTLLKTPDEVETEFKSNASDAEQDAADYNDEVNRTPSSKTTQIYYNGNLTSMQSVVDSDAARIRKPVIALQYRTGQTAV